jgi:hypothetical protein
MAAGWAQKMQIRGQQRQQQQQEQEQHSEKGEQRSQGNDLTSRRRCGISQASREDLHRLQLISII